MAEAFARMYGGDSIEAYSAGSRPSGRVNPKAIEAMYELGYDLSKHESKSLSDIPVIEYDLVATSSFNIPKVKGYRCFLI